MHKLFHSWQHLIPQIEEDLKTMSVGAVASKHQIGESSLRYNIRNNRVKYEPVKLRLTASRGGYFNSLPTDKKEAFITRVRAKDEYITCICDDLGISYQRVYPELSTQSIIDSEGHPLLFVKYGSMINEADKALVDQMLAENKHKKDILEHDFTGPKSSIRKYFKHLAKAEGSAKFVDRITQLRRSIETQRIKVNTLTATLEEQTNILNRMNQDLAILERPVN